MLLYKVLSFPVPINKTSDHATQLLDLPQIFAVTNDLKLYTTLDLIDLNNCNSGKIYLCKYSKVLSVMSDDTCVSALFKGDTLLIKRKCNFRFLVNHLSANMVQLSHTSVLLYNVHTFHMNCKGNTKVNKGCTFCIINVPCECSLATDTLYLPPRLSACHKNTTSMLHPVNLALLQQFFNDTELQNIGSNLLFENPMSVDVPQFKIYNHSMQNILADDRKNHLNLEKMAKAAKNDALIFQTMTDPLLYGDIALQNDWPSSDDILLYCTTAVTSFCLIIIVVLSLKLRKVLITLSILQKSTVKTAHAATVPSFVYKKPTTTQSPDSYFLQNLDIRLEHYILTFTVLTMILVFILVIKKCTIRNRSTQIIAEITNGKTCIHFPLHNLSLCPNYWKITVPQEISCIQVQGLWNPIVTFSWDVFKIQNILNEQVFHISPYIKVNCLKSKRLRNIMKTTYSVHFYVKHKNLLIPQF
jgi:hypothetical protein